MTKVRHLILLCATCALGASWLGTSHAMDARIAVLTPENLSGVASADSLVLDHLLRELLSGTKEILTPEQSRPILRSHRLRSVGQIAPTGAKVLRNELGATHVLLTSIVLYEIRPPFEVAITARLFDTASSEICGAWTTARSAQDGLDWFGASRLESAEAVALSLIEDLVASVRDVDLDARSASENRTRVAVIPLDTWTDDTKDGRRLQQLAISALLASGVAVVEPGFVHEALLENGVTTRGGADLATIGALRTALKVDWILTGDVDRFARASGATGANPPRVALGLRLISAPTGKLVTAWERERRGDDDLGLLQSGRQSSAAQLADSILRGIAHDILSQPTRSSR
jgi:hypothetical protein